MEEISRKGPNAVEMCLLMMVKLNEVTQVHGNCVKLFHAVFIVFVMCSVI